MACAGISPTCSRLLSSCVLATLCIPSTIPFPACTVRVCATCHAAPRPSLTQLVVWGFISIGEKLITASVVIMPLHGPLGGLASAIEAPLVGYPNLELTLVMGAPRPRDAPQTPAATALA